MVAATELALVAQARNACEMGDAWSAAGAVLGGGAVELRLRRFMTRTGATLKKGAKPSIDNYMTALEQHRASSPNDVYPSTDDTSLERWRQMRNAAAHDPATFTTDAGYSAAKVLPELLLIEEWLRRTGPMI